MMEIQKLKPNQLIIEIHEKALSAAQEYVRKEVLLLETLAEVEQHKVFLAMGCDSLYQYCRKALHLSEGVSYNLIQVMRKARAVPEIKILMAAGELTLSNARTVAAVINSDNKADLLQLACSLSKRELERRVVEFAAIEAKPMGGVGSSGPNTRDGARNCHEGNGARADVKYKIVKGLGAAMKRASLNLVSDNAFVKLLERIRELESKRQRRNVSLEEAARAAAESYLQRHDPVEKAKRCMKRPNGNQPVPGQVAIKALLAKSQTTRKPVPATNLHQVSLRDGGQCQFVGLDGHKCLSKFYTQVHHVVPIARGGSNDVANLITLCSKHHAFVHPENERFQRPLYFFDEPGVQCTDH